MTPDITQFLTEGGEVLNENNKHVDNLIQYLDESLCTLINELDEKNFHLILEILTEQIFAITFNVIGTNLEVSVYEIKMFKGVGADDYL